jgi:predicted lipoprotein
MRWLRGSAVAPIAAASALYALSGGCERVSYYSLSGASSSGGSPSSGAGPGGGAAVTRAGVLAAVGTCAAALYKDFAAAAQELDAAAQAAASAPSVETRETARAAWKKAVGLWQQAELVRVGPAGPATQPEGENLRDFVVSWPLVSRCLVEQTIVAKAYESATFPQTALINVRGLNAGEYLLFYEGTDNACSASATINTSGSWAALGPAELAGRKAAYAAVVSADVAAKARALADAWDPANGAFGARLASAGESGSPFGSAQAALNAVSDGMFYLEREVKDLKLGRPLGLVECSTPTCPEAVESQYARIGRDHIRNNLVGFRRIFAGCEEQGGQVGFDDLLAAMGAEPLATRMSGDIDAAIEAADALAGPDIVSALEEDREGLEQLHASIKNVTDALKTEFVSVLDLEIPKVVEGDND